MKQYFTQYTKLKNGKLPMDVFMIFEKSEQRTVGQCGAFVTQSMTNGDTALRCGKLRKHCKHKA